MLLKASLMSPNLIALIIILVIILIIFIRNIRVVPQAHTYVIERLGTYQDTWHAGIHAKMPFIDKVVRRVSLKEKVADFPPQAVITKDNVTMEIDTVIFYQVVDSKLYSYGIENPIAAIENLSATTLRNVIGDLELDETLTSRDHINSIMRTILDEATEGLAPLIAREIWRICDLIRKSGISSIIVDKNWKHVTQVTDRNVVLVKGEVVFEGASELLRQQPELLTQHLGV